MRQVVNVFTASLLKYFQNAHVAANAISLPSLNDTRFCRLLSGDIWRTGSNCSPGLVIFGYGVFVLYV
uniref:Uncharacterized protein n=1 Tax=Anguilla anguilla TaxID=7936 RepID=A0A0E9VSB5_ANGAN